MTNKEFLLMNSINMLFLFSLDYIVRETFVLRNIIKMKACMWWWCSSCIFQCF